VPCQALARDRPSRVVLGPCLNGPCSCRPNGLSPFGHLYQPNGSAPSPHQSGARRCRGGRAATRSSPAGRGAGAPPAEILQATPNILDRDGGWASHCIPYAPSSYSSSFARRSTPPVSPRFITNRDRSDAMRARLKQSRVQGYRRGPSCDHTIYRGSTKQ
jgi:hypothetical protein